jgi:hypothetical protein
MNGTIFGWGEISEHKMCVLILSTTLSGTFLILRISEIDDDDDDDDDDHHHHHLPPCIRSLDPFRHRRVAIVSWGAHDLFFL